MWAVKVVAVATIAGSPNQARTRFLQNYPARIQVAFTARGLTGSVSARIIERPDLGPRVWEFYPKTSLHDARSFAEITTEYRAIRDFLVTDLESWLTAEGHTVTAMFSKPV